MVLRDHSLIHSLSGFHSTGIVSIEAGNVSIGSLVNNIFNSVIHQAARLTVSWLRLVPFQWNRKMSIVCEWETSGENVKMVPDDIQCCWGYDIPVELPVAPPILFLIS